MHVNADTTGTQTSLKTGRAQTTGGDTTLRDDASAFFPTLLRRIFGVTSATDAEAPAKEATVRHFRPFEVDVNKSD